MKINNDKGHGTEHLQRTRETLIDDFTHRVKVARTEPNLEIDAPKQNNGSYQFSEGGGEKEDTEKIREEMWDEIHHENELISKLATAISDIDTEDLQFIKLLMKEAHGPHPRAMLYLFIPVLAYDAIKTRFNKRALQRLQIAADAYRNYQETIRNHVGSLLNRRTVREALGDDKLVTSLKPKNSLLKRFAFQAIREFAGLPETYWRRTKISASEQIIRATLKALFLDSEASKKRRKSLIGRITESYVKAMVFQKIDEITYENRFEAVKFFVNNQERMNPFVQQN